MVARVATRFLPSFALILLCLFLIYVIIFQVLAGEISPFMCTGIHLVQTDMFPSAVRTVLEGVTKCSPSIPLRPCIFKVSSFDSVNLIKKISYC